MEYNNIISELKNNKVHPVYFLSGEEPFFIDKISSYLEKNLLSNEEKSFDQHILYGNETDINTIISYAKRFPMIAKKQLVIVKEAQNLKKIEDITSYLKKPQPSTVLAFCHKYKKIDKRKSIYSILAKNSIYFESKTLYANQVAEVVSSLLKEQGFTISQESLAILCETLGNNLTKINKEIEKLTIALPNKSEVTPNLIEEHIGISKEYNNFELQKAIGKKDFLKAQKIVKHFSLDPIANPLVVTIGILYSYFSKLLIFHNTIDKSKMNIARILKVNPYFVNDYSLGANKYSNSKCIEAISHLKKCDLSSKGINNSNTSSGELLKELVFKIMH